MREITIATANGGKASELQELLGDVARVVTPHDLPVVEEDGQTLRENAFKKARSAADYLEAEAVADDSGLFVVALGGLPGVRSARFAGERASDGDNREKLLSSLSGKTDRSSYFDTVLCLCAPGQDMSEAEYFEGRCQGKIATVDLGTHGFGYDSIFIPDEGDGRSFGEMDSIEKAQYSHRSKAIFQLKKWMS